MGGWYEWSNPYDVVGLPLRAKAAGQAWGDTFARLSVHEQQRIIVRLTVERIRASARKAGKPEPMIVEAILKPLPGGGYELDVSKPYRPLRKEWGGRQEDGAIQIAYPTSVDNTRNNPAAIANAQRLAAQFEAYYADEARPQRKARSR
jgi:hypothetical protein